MKYSLRNFLLISILLTIVMLGSVTIWGSYRASVNEVEELFDAQLARSARLMLGLALTEVNLGHIKEFTDNVTENRPKISEKQLIEQEVSRHGHFYELKLAYQVWDSYGNMLLRSDNAPLQPLSDIREGYANQQFNQQNWRTFSLYDASRRFQVITAEREDVRNDLVKKITLQMIWPFLLLVPLIGALVWYFIGRGLKPLDSIASEIASRKDERLEPLAFERVPVEIQPLVDELNRLFESLKASFEKERRFTSDAAHELRTPLAVLKTHLQLMESSKNDEDKQLALQAISQGVERASHLVDQLLGLAHLEPQSIRAMQKKETVDLHALCVDLVAEIYPLCRQKNQEISIQASEKVSKQASIEGYRYPLEIMIRNLLSNSVRYTPENGEILLEMKRDGSSLELLLHDSGPGIPETQREQVLHRFRKVEGDTHSGSGIGLSIVKRVAELHAMQLDLVDSSSLGGLCVHLRLKDV